MPLEITDFTPCDENKILELFESAFGKKLPLDFWKWRFLDNIEKQQLIKLYWDEKTLAGHYAVFPQKINIGNKQFAGALSMTTMTHPAYGGRGIFSKLAEDLYSDIAENKNYKAVWGFPNKNSHYGFIKNLKWADLYEIPTFSLETQFLKKTDNTIKWNTFDTFNEKHSGFLENSLKPFAVSIYKSVDYLNWRYKYHPVNTYNFFEAEHSEGNFCVSKSFSPHPDSIEIDILECCVEPDESLLRSLIYSLIDFYGKEKVKKINMWLPLWDKKHIIFEKIGFENQLPVTYFGCRVLDNEFSELFDIRNWHFTMGDSDIY